MPNAKTSPSRRRRNLCQPRWPRSRTAKVLSAPPLYHQAMATESRLVEFRDMEVKGRNFRGVAAVYDTPWSDKLAAALGFVEEVGRGALRNALGLGENIPPLGAHRRHELLATTEARTLKLADDAGRGLDVEADLPKNYLGDYYREMVHRGDIAASWGSSRYPKTAFGRNGTAATTAGSRTCRGSWT